MNPYKDATPNQLNFINAVPSDAQELTDLAERSKRHWGYSKEAMELWRENLTITEDYINQHTIIKAMYKDVIVGFYVLETIQPTTRIAHFWLDTPFLRKGFGSVIFKHLTDFLKEKNVQKTSIVVDPNTLGFFERLGGKAVARIEHKVKNKHLDIVEFNL